ncbi:MAG: hypothetical protein ACW98D_18825 [Promethearchaeota archaeon]|jgi:hypothetical protein
MKNQLMPFLYGFLLEVRKGTETDRAPRELGEYLAFDLVRSAEAVFGLWARDEKRQRLDDVLNRMGDLEGVDHLKEWHRRRTEEGKQSGIMALDDAVMSRPDIPQKQRSRNLTKKAAYDPNDPRFNASLSPEGQINMDIQSRRRGNARNNPAIKHGSFNHVLYLKGHPYVHPRMGPGNCCEDALEHQNRIKDHKTYVVCYHHEARLTRLDWELKGHVSSSISGIKNGLAVVLPCDFYIKQELVLEIITRRYVDHQPLWQIGFEMSQFYEKVMPQKFRKAFFDQSQHRDHPRGYFGLIPLMSEFSDIAYKIKEATIESLWKDERGRIRYDFLGHGIEVPSVEAKGIFGGGYRPSYIFVKRENRPFRERQRVHIVVNPKTQLAHYIFKVPIGRGGVFSRAKPLLTYKETCPAFRQQVYCAVFKPRAISLGPELAGLYNRTMDQ